MINENITAKSSKVPPYESTNNAPLTYEPPCRLQKVIREDFTIEAYDILELHCELVAERMRLVASQKDVPPDMDQAISTLIWAADRAEVCCLVFLSLPSFLPASLPSFHNSFLCVYVAFVGARKYVPGVLLKMFFPPFYSCAAVPRLYFRVYCHVLMC